MHQFLLDRALSPRPLVARLFRPIKSAVARLHDRTVRYRLNGRTLAMPLSHDLPATRYLHPNFSENLRRLANFMRELDGALCMIDVGANVGDTWALAAGDPADTFLLIEGSERYFRLLERNTAGVRGVALVQSMLSDSTTQAHGEVAIGRGNGWFVAGDEAAALLNFRTLDGVLEAHDMFSFANLLKVDVEGFDARVLRGARQLLATSKPTILFEHQPHQLARANQDDRAVFADLAAMGYRRYILYDNRGYLISAVSIDEGAWLETFLAYARQQPDYFFDICCFHDSRAAEREAFYERDRDAMTGGRAGLGALVGRNAPARAQVAAPAATLTPSGR